MGAGAWVPDRGASLQVTETTLARAMKLPEAGALVSIVGGGGKSALLFGLGARLPGRVILSTTTRIFSAQIAHAVTSTSLDAPTLETTLADAPSGLLVVGRVEGAKAIGVDPTQPARWLARDDVRYVVVEADGSRMRPTKAPADHEPVLAAGTTHVVISCGIDALEGTIGDVCHRPERVASLLDVALDRRLDAPALARLLVHRQGGSKHVADSMRTTVVLNKVENDLRRQRAQIVAEAALEAPHVDRVLYGALEGPQPDCWACCERV